MLAILSSFTFASDCDHALVTPAAALAPIAQGEDGRWSFEIHHAIEPNQVRTIELPAILASLRGQNELRLVVLAGNSGEEYARTRHNLGHLFADYFLAQMPSADEVQSRETIAVRYDDGSVVDWSTTFRTRVPQNRTVTGEVFYFAEHYAKPILFVKLIGDYNEVGDFAVAILDSLELPAKNLLLLHDDLNLAQGEVKLVRGAQTSNGNNAVFSIIRNLAYGAEMESLIRSRYDLSTAQWLELKASFRQGADARSGEFSFRSTETIVAGLHETLKFVESQTSIEGKQRLRQLKDKLSELKRPLGELSAQIKNESPGTPRHAELTAERTHILELSSPISIESRKLQDDLDVTEKQFFVDLRNVIAGRLSFSRLSIGTANGSLDRKNLRAFVLAPIDPKDFRDTFAQADVELAQWLHDSI